MGSDSSPRYWPFHGVNLLLLAALWAFTALAWDDLPARIPAHMGPSGVTSWTDRGSGMWFLLPIMGTIEAGMMYALSLLANITPGPGINVPHKERLLELSPDGRRHAMEPVRPFMYGMAGWLVSLMLVLQVFLFSAARAGSDGEGGAALMWVLLFFGLVPLIAVWWLHGAVGRRIEGWRRRQASR